MSFSSGLIEEEFIRKREAYRTSLRPDRQTSGHRNKISYRLVNQSSLQRDPFRVRLVDHSGKRPLNPYNSHKRAELTDVDGLSQRCSAHI